MWLALRFDHWPLDSRIGADETGPALVVEEKAQRQTVIAASDTARHAGICRGMALADARMRLADVQVHRRDQAAERAAMSRLLGWAWRYSDQIHGTIAEADMVCARLVLEIGASLRLFGGRDVLLARIRKDLKKLGYRYRQGLGQTPQAALAFACHRGRPVSDPGHLPITSLELDEDIRTTLSASGIGYIAELLALPPGTLMRRFGTPLLHALERLQGQRPHGLALYTLPTRYRTRHELLGVVENTQGLVFVLRRVFEALSVFLRGADSAIQTLRLDLVHERGPATSITLRLSAPSRDARHIERVALERLDRLTLEAPIQAIALRSDRLRRMAHHQQRFWQTTVSQDNDPWTAVLDRLRARLGHNSVYWIVDRPEHRPEHASVIRDEAPAPASEPGQADPLPRPLWLLDTPEPIDESALAALEWLSGPERIESGWWAEGQRRDYYRALDCGGRLAWVFRDLEATRRGGPLYYLHGLFA